MNDFYVGGRVAIVDRIFEDELDWYKILAIEDDPEAGVQWLYLLSEVDKFNVHQSPYGLYAELIESVSDRIRIE